MTFHNEFTVRNVFHLSEFFFKINDYSRIILEILKKLSLKKIPYDGNAVHI